MKKLTIKEKNEIASLAYDKSVGIENGTLLVYQNFKTKEFKILINSEYRDNVHLLICELLVANENSPYTKTDFMRQLDFIENQQ